MMTQTVVSSSDSPTLDDLIGCRIQYVYARPDGQKPIITTGIIREIKQRNNILYMLVEPRSKKRLPKWRTEFDFLGYIR